MLFLQLCLYCLLFFLLVKADGRNCLYFYPKEYIDEAAKRGLADPAATMAKGKRLWTVGAAPGGDELVRRAGH